MWTRLQQIVLIIVFVPSMAAAAAFIVPPDEAMVASADAIFIGTVISSTPRFDSDGEIVSDVLFRVERALKGAVGESILVTVPGGIIGDRGRFVSGAPEYRPGERALVFLEAGLDPPWRTWNLELGKFSFVSTRDGHQVLVRGADEGEIFGWDFLGRRHREPIRDAERFIEFVAARAAGAPFVGDYIMDPPQPLPEKPSDPTVGESSETVEGTQSSTDEAQVISDAHYPPSAYTMGKFRWALFDDGGTAGYKITSSQPGYDSVGAAQRALAAWTNDPGSNVRLTLLSGSGGGFTRDGVNSIIYNNSTDVPSGAIGYAQVYSQGTHTYKGETFYTVVEGDVAMRSNLTISAKVFDEAVTHEVGHTIALRHSDTAEPSSNSAVMKSVLTGNYGATLAPWDIEAVGHVYTAPVSVCSPPSILQQPSSTTISSGDFVTLSVSATGTTPLNYQWFTGSSGSGSAIQGATGASLQVAPGTTTSYWVSVSNSCGSVNSTTATVTVATTGTAAGTASGLYVLNPCRLFDTRDPIGPSGGPAIPPGTVRTLVAAGKCGVSVGAKSAAINLTVVVPAAGGFLTAYPGTGHGPPLASTLNYKTGRTLANNAVVRLSSDGKISIYNSGPVAVHAIVDVTGYFQ
jgi:hypothetical protein